MDAIKRISVFRTISTTTVFIYDGYNVIEEFEVNHRSDDAYGQVRKFVNACKDKWTVKINDEDGIL